MKLLSKMVYSTTWAGVVAKVLCVCTFICFADGVRFGAADDEKSVWKTMIAREQKGSCGDDLSWVFE